MRIVTDFRTPDFIELERKRNSFNWNRVLFFFLFIGYFAVSGWYFGTSGWKFWQDRTKLRNAERMVQEFRNMEEDFNAQIEESMTVIESKRLLLNELENDPAIIDAMLTLTKSSPQDGYLDRVVVERQTRNAEDILLNLMFYVQNESSVVEVNSGLLRDTVFRSLSMPRMSREDPTKIQVRLSGIIEDVATLAGSRPSKKLSVSD